MTNVFLVSGDDPVLRVEATRDLIARVLGADDPTLAVEEFEVSGGGDDDGAPTRGDGMVVARAVVNAAQTPPFGTEHRIVVLRETGALNAAEAAPLIEYLADPMPTTLLVLVAGGGALPAALSKAVKAAGAEEIAAGKGKPDAVLAAVFADHELTLSRAAIAEVLAHVGEELGALPALADLLVSAFGPGARLDVDDIEPYLVGAGGVPPYQLSNALDSGDSAEALTLLHRLRTATGSRQQRGWHPMQVIGFLHSHYARMLRLDDPDISSDDDAAAALGGRMKPWAAGKRWQQAQRLGRDGLRSAIDLIAQADLDLRGASALPEDAVLEVLVARLCALSRSPAHRRRPEPARMRTPGRR